MQEHREITPDRLITGRDQRFRRCPDDDPVPIFDWTAEQFVADGAANPVDLHGEE